MEEESPDDIKIRHVDKVEPSEDVGWDSRGSIHVDNEEPQENLQKNVILSDGLISELVS